MGFYIGLQGEQHDLANSSVIGLLKNYPKTQPVRHKKYGLGWVVEFSPGHTATYFLEHPDILAQELLAQKQLNKNKKKGRR